MKEWTVSGMTGIKETITVEAETKEAAEILFIERFPKTFTESMVTREIPANGGKANP